MSLSLAVTQNRSGIRRADLCFYVSFSSFRTIFIWETYLLCIFKTASITGNIDFCRKIFLTFPNFSLARLEIKILLDLCSSWPHLISIYLSLKLFLFYDFVFVVFPVTSQMINIDVCQWRFLNFVLLFSSRNASNFFARLGFKLQIHPFAVAHHPILSVSYIQLVTIWKTCLLCLPKV